LQKSRAKEPCKRALQKSLATSSAKEPFKRALQKSLAKEPHDDTRANERQQEWYGVGIAIKENYVFLQKICTKICNANQTAECV